MSKSKKNTIDPEIMIKEYGADSVRWFILSDSPPEKDVQWSDAGVVSSSKFLQKIWNLNQIILNKKNTKAKVDQKVQKSFENRVDICVYKVDQSIKNFQFNVAIAQFYEIYKFFNESAQMEISKECLISNLVKLMKLMIPFIPHLAYECLTNLKCNDLDQWPKINKEAIKKSEVKLVIQVNGKTRDILNIKRDLKENDITLLVKKNSKAKKYIMDKKIIRTVFVENKIINYIVNN